MLGTALFYYIEKEYDTNDLKHKMTAQKHFNSKLQTKYNMSYDEVTNLVAEFKKAYQDSSGLEWSFQNSLYFVIQVITTIGKLLYWI